MILLYATVLLIILALYFRPELKHIGYIEFRGGWKLVVAAVVLFVLQWTLVVTDSERSILHTALLVLSHTAALLLVWANRHLPGARLFALGIFLNTLVMLANGGWMPVTPEIASYVKGDPALALVPSGKNTVLPYEQTHLWLLSDIIPVALPWRRWAVSIGDLLLIAGVARFLFRAAPKQVSISDASQLT